jgi:predicted cation transporter
MEQAKTKFDVPILAQVALGFALSALVLIGHSFGLGAALMAAVLGAAAVVWALPGWMPVQRARLADAVVYGFAAAGLIYLGQMVAGGPF